MATLGNLEAQMNRPKNSFLLCFSPKREQLPRRTLGSMHLRTSVNIKFRFLAKNAPPSDPVRIKYDRAFQLAFSEEFERSFTPIDYFFASAQKFFITSVSEIQKRFSFKDNVFQILPLVRQKTLLIFVLHPCLPYSNVFLCSMTIAMLLRQKKNGDLMSIFPLITLKLILVNLPLHSTTWM